MDLSIHEATFLGKLAEDAVRAWIAEERESCSIPPVLSTSEEAVLLYYHVA